MDETPSDAVVHGPRSVGYKLAEARQAQNIELSAVAAHTRIPIRHLEAIEKDNRDALPAIAYSVGFVRSYAQFLGLDANALARDYRNEMGGQGAQRPAPLPFEPADPARVPPRFLALVALGIAILIASGYAMWRSGWASGQSSEQRAQIAAGSGAVPVDSPPSASIGPAAVRAPASPTPADDTVVLTATAPVWVRVYEANGGPRLLEKQMDAGESFTVPPGAVDPRILTGRPQSLQVTVGGRAIPMLGPPERTIADVSLKPAALLARLTAPPPASTGSPTPTAPATGR